MKMLMDEVSSACNKHFIKFLPQRSQRRRRSRHCSVRQRRRSSSTKGKGKNAVLLPPLRALLLRSGKRTWRLFWHRQTCGTFTANQLSPSPLSLSLLNCFNNLISKWLPAAFDLLQNASEKYNQMQVKKLTVPANSEATTKRAALGDLQNRGLNRVLATKDVANKE